MRDSSSSRVVESGSAKPRRQGKQFARSALLPHLWPETLVYLGTETPVPAGAPIYDQAGREWRLRCAFKPGLTLTACGYERGQVIVNNGARNDRTFLVDFFPAVEFRRVAPLSSEVPPLGSSERSEAEDHHPGIRSETTDPTLNTQEGE